MADREGAVANETVFAWAWRRFLLAAAVVGAGAGTLGWLAGTWLFSLAADRPWPPSTGEAVASILVYATAFPLFSLLLVGRLPSRPALRPDGIDMAAARQDGVLIPYDAISRVRAPWFWPVTVLEVSVDAAAHVVPLQRGAAEHHEDAQAASTGSCCPWQAFRCRQGTSPPESTASATDLPETCFDARQRYRSDAKLNSTAHGRHGEADRHEATGLSGVRGSAR